jgi:opacity protein-like surface antigen
MKTALVGLGSLLLLSGCCFAQQAPRTEIFGGYSLEHVSACGPAGSNAFFVCLIQNGVASVHNYNGWNASGAVFVYRFLGFAADFSGHYGTTTASGTQAFGAESTSRYSYMFGPVAAVRNRKIAPFTHALFGGIANNFAHSSVLEGSNYTGFAWAIGGGIDMALTRHWAVRVGQFDYERANEPAPNNANSGANGFRFSTGIVFKP